MRMRSLALLLAAGLVLAQAQAPGSPTRAAFARVGVEAPAPKEKFAPAKGESPVRLLRVDKAAGLELWQTWLGPFWISPQGGQPGGDLLRFLQWEQVVQQVYSHPLAQVRQGDVVIDCGAHVGIFTRVALRRGARMVVAVEPERINRAAFERNFASELRSGRVRLVPLGVWEKPGHLTLRLSTVNTGSHSFVFDKDIRGTENIPVTTLDALAESEKLPRVDFIKMDIEGAERQALRGARAILHRWRPRLAVASYHLRDDPPAISAAVWAARPDYRVATKNLELPRHGVILPKVLFFY